MADPAATPSAETTTVAPLAPDVDASAPLRHPLTVLCVLSPLALLGELYRFLSERKAGLFSDDHWHALGGIVGIDAPLIPALALIIGCLAVQVIGRQRWTWPLPSTIALVLLWGVIWAGVRCTMGLTVHLGSGGGASAAPLQTMPAIGRIGLAVSGAIQEEILFRGALLGAVGLILNHLLRGRWAGYALALPLSAVLFSLAHTNIVNHHPGAEAFTWSAFSQRTAAGLLYGYVFLRQGLAVTCL
ncbi:MAG: CPBP family glutamic-type intramembrane protease, partial [Planctomycetota bacterium]